MLLPETLVQDDLGLIRVKGHRISLDDLLHYYLEGDSAEMLQARYPTLSLNECTDAIKLYEQHPEEVENYLRVGREAAARYRALYQGKSPSLDELKRRRAAARLAPGA